MKHTPFTTLSLNLALFASMMLTAGTAYAQALCDGDDVCGSGSSCVNGTCQPDDDGTSSGGGTAGAGSTTSRNTTNLIFPKDGNLQLLQPLDETTPGSGTRFIPPQSGINIIFVYFALAWPWFIGTAAGFAVLQGVVGGVQIMYGGGPEAVSEGKTRFQWALFGLLMVGLGGVILRILNPTFYV